MFTPACSFQCIMKGSRGRDSSKHPTAGTKAEKQRAWRNNAFWLLNYVSYTAQAFCLEMVLPTAASVLTHLFKKHKMTSLKCLWSILEEDISH